MALCYILARVFPPPFTLPEKGSGIDVQLSRAAALAQRRKDSGIEDRFLFLVDGQCDQEAAETGLRDYGFPACEVLFGSDVLYEPDEDVPVSFDDDYRESVGYELERWLDKQYPGALPLSALLAAPGGELDAYRDIDWWWIGVEGRDSAFDWPFESEGFSCLLPHTHAPRSETWLAILEAFGDFPDLSYGGSPLATFRVQAITAALAEWLHGFEAASGNSWNLFQPELALDVLELNPILLGCDVSQDWAASEEPPEAADDDDELLRSAVRALTRKYRLSALQALGGIGHDGAVFFCLYRSIWPKYDVPLSESVAGLLGLNEVEFGELAAAWGFVSDGWHERADVY